MPLSTQAPFFTERGMIYFRLPIADCRFAAPRYLAVSIGNRKSKIGNLLDSPISHDHLLRTLVPARLVAARRLSPGRYRIAPTRGLTLAAPVRMVERIHRHAAHVRPNTAPARG